MITTHESLIYSSSSLLIVLLLILQNIHFCEAKHDCTPSACGIISNISSPFRLSHDPKHCGDRVFELACENNVTFVNLNSQKYYVKAINYDTATIRVVDASIDSKDICSFPNYSAYAYNFDYFYYSHYHPYLTPRYSYRDIDDIDIDLLTPINFISCPLLLRNSSPFTEIKSYCGSASHSQEYAASYIKVGHINASELPQTCKLELMVMTSWSFKEFNNTSLSEVHSSLLYGFELTICSSCTITKWERYAQAFFFRKLNGLLVILLVVAVFLSAGLGPPMMIIIVLTGGLGFISFEAVFKFETASFPFYVLHIVAITAPRVIIFPLAMWLLIYKFRRRHLSRFEGIESFLQSDNRLIPIRYTYSDIKKMTKRFQEKLGEGGYGYVYKGKLRSGNDVAIKLLGKSGENWQDFMNEIATIGRIHHVNIVKLVGYCVERSKRALVFDFMPNGSLEKFLFNQDKMNLLSWTTKFDIAVGIARGIEYLHKGCDIQILHFDIKPHNILLDENFIPKISDFGLAKYFSTEKTSVTMTAVRGTIGYVAPELINRGIGAVSYKADVYSFGMLLMEIVGLKRNLVENNDDSTKYFPYWIYDHFKQGKDIEIGLVDENSDYDDENDGTRKVARKMTIVALWCIRMSPDDRPSMNKVLEMLEGEVERLQIPDYPSQSSQIEVNVDETGITCWTDSVSLLLHHDDSSFNVEITVEE